MLENKLWTDIFSYIKFDFFYIYTLQIRKKRRRKNKIHTNNGLMHDNAIRGVEADGGAIGEDKTKTREEEVPREGNRAECDDEGRCGQSGEGDKEGPRRHPPTRHGEVLGGHAGEMVEVEPVID